MKISCCHVAQVSKITLKQLFDDLSNLKSLRLENGEKNCFFLFKY